MRGAVILLLAVLCGCGRTELVRYTPEPVDGGRPFGPCMNSDFAPEPVVPAVMLVVDRSGSMQFDLAGNTGGLFGQPLTGPRRWDVLRASLDKSLRRFDQSVAFGLVLFPDDDSCTVSSAIAVQPAAGNANAVLGQFAREPNGGTPTFDAVNSASGQLAELRAQALVLITDGDPNCNPLLNRNTCDCTGPTLGTPPVCGEAEACRDETRAVSSVLRARLDCGVVTYVVGVGSNSTTVVQTLDNLAIAGGVPLYSGATEAELSEALLAISTRLTRCTWSTRTQLTAGDQVEVTVGGQLVPKGSSGWDWVDPATGDFSLRGVWCERAADGEEVQVKLICR